MGLTPPAPGIWFPPWVCLVPAAHSALYTMPILYTNTIPRARVWQIIHGSWQIIHRLCSAYTPFTALAAHGRTLTSLAALNALRGLLAPYRYISILRRRACAVVVGFPRAVGVVLSIVFMRAAQFPAPWLLYNRVESILARRAVPWPGLNPLKSEYPCCFAILALWDRLTFGSVPALFGK